MNKHHDSTLEPLFEELDELDELRLRALIKCVLVEDEDLLKKWATGGSHIEQELAKLNIVPLYHGDEGTSELGRGMMNVVLDVLYKGKRAVARISRRYGELDSLLKFIAFKAKLPSKYAKHFPTVFTTFKFQDGKDHYQGAVVEILEPMPPGLEFDLDTMSLTDNLQRSRVSMILNDHSIIEDIVDDAIAIKSVQGELIAMFEESIRGKLLSWVGKPLTEFDDWLLNVLDKAALEHKFETAFYRFGKGLLNALRGSIIPDTPTEKRGPKNLPYGHTSKKVREFYEFLQELEHAGMKWGDLHTGNFMVRGSTGDFVVVDPGYFDSSGR